MILPKFVFCCCILSLVVKLTESSPFLLEDDTKSILPLKPSAKKESERGISSNLPDDLGDEDVSNSQDQESNQVYPYFSPLEENYSDVDSSQMPSWLKKLVKSKLYNKKNKDKRVSRPTLDFSDPANQDVLNSFFNWYNQNGSGTAQSRFGRSINDKSNNHHKSKLRKSNENRSHKGPKVSFMRSAAAQRVLRYFLRYFRKGGRMQFRFG